MGVHFLSTARGAHQGPSKTIKHAPPPSELHRIQSMAPHPNGLNGWISCTLSRMDCATIELAGPNEGLGWSDEPQNLYKGDPIQIYLTRVVLPQDGPHDNVRTVIPCERYGLDHYSLLCVGVGVCIFFFFFSSSNSKWILLTEANAII